VFLALSGAEKNGRKNYSCDAGFQLIQRIVKNRAIFLAFLGIKERNGHLHAEKCGRP
jgi:hypothetical protein